jgi:alanine-glyoxylate transaminase/serine-glyoxylate transaminase/serine-pyruvate transaminase
MTTLQPLNPTPRRLFGPGPTNVSAEVLDAMRKPMLGHLDPEFHSILDEVVGMLSVVYRREHGLTFAISGTGTAGLEAGLAALVGPDDKIIVGTAGFFGDRILTLAQRTGAEVVVLRAAPGEHVPTESFVDALERHPDAAMVAFVHADTSTGVRQPVAELTAALAGSDALLFVDCVTSLGGIEVDAEGWGLDFCFSCTQKCLGAPPGMSPVTLSERALKRIHDRAEGGSAFYFDFGLLARYWIDRPITYHHTIPVLQIYALHEALRSVLVEGLEDRWNRHADAGGYLQNQLQERGLKLLADPLYQLPQLTAVRVPEGIDGRAVQQRLVTEYGIEIGGPLGSAGPSIWRIGLMGINATREAADTVLGALDEVLVRTGVAAVGAGTSA